MLSLFIIQHILLKDDEWFWMWDRPFFVKNRSWGKKNHGRKEKKWKKLKWSRMALGIKHTVLCENGLKVRLISHTERECGSCLEYHRIKQNYCTKC